MLPKFNACGSHYVLFLFVTATTTNYYTVVIFQPKNIKFYITLFLALLLAPVKLAMNLF